MMMMFTFPFSILLNIVAKKMKYFFCLIAMTTQQSYNSFGFFITVHWSTDKKIVWGFSTVLGSF